MNTICLVVGTPEDPEVLKKHQAAFLWSVLRDLATGKAVIIRRDCVETEDARVTIEIAGGFNGRGMSDVFRIERIVP